jgi:hypothetical protein
MQRRMRKYVVTAALGLSLGGAAMADTGPVQTPLRVAYLYTKGGNGALYVGFQAGAMPGCYGNSGGYLFPTNSAYKEIYSQLMLMVANGGLKAGVLYTKNTITNNWGDCTIDGIFLQE